MNDGITKLKNTFKDCSDFIAKDLYVGNEKFVLFFIDNLVDKKNLNENFLKPLLEVKKLPPKNKVDFLVNQQISSGTIKKLSDEKAAENEILIGSAVIGIESEEVFMSVSVQGYSKRGITEPPTSAVIKGPREGFTEDYETNLSLIRRRIKTSNLVVKEQSVGRQTQTKVAVLYLKNVAKQNVVDEILKRISGINIDGIVDSFYIQEFLEGRKNSIFKQAGSSEKPDVVTAKILEGRVAIVVDGSPIVLTLPFVLIEDIQSSDDYYNHAVRATFVRIIRVMGMVLGVLLPGLYVATQVFHYRILPINFLISLLNSVQGLSFPPLIEILFVLFLFELLNEASIRMPRYLGMALSIIGALVLGETAVQAGLISPSAIVVVAISGITIYTVPDQVGTLSILRLVFTLIGGIAGYYGLLIGSIFLFAYLAQLESYGTPYLAPYAPNVQSDKKDAIIKQGIRAMKTRPQSFPNKNKTRMNNDKIVE